MTRALVVTSTTPPLPGRDVEGHYKRLRLFMDAIGMVADRVEMVHLVPQRVVDLNSDARALSQAQAEHWGFPVSIELIPWRERANTFYNYYVKGILSASEQPKFFGPSGPEQAAALASALDRGHDLVFVHRLPAMCALLRTGRRLDGVAFDIDDVEHRMKLRASLQPPFRPGALFSIAQVPAIVAAERAASARSRLMFVCSETDQRKLRRLGIARGITVVPNAVRIPQAQPNVTAEPTMLFIGDYGYDPNREAAERLATRVLPLVRRCRPDATLLIAGKRTERLSPAARAEQGVELLGFVEDLDQLYARVRVVCCPIRKGGGTRVKLIEGAAYGKPLVSTRVGAEGLVFKDGREIVLVDDDDGLADACVRLLRYDDLCRSLGEAARETVRRDYEADSIRDRIAGLLRGVIPPGSAR